MLLGVYMASMDAVMYPKERFFTHLLPMNLLQNAAWGVSGLGILALARRWPLEHLSAREWPRLAMHLVGSVLVALVGLAVIWGISLLFLDPQWRAKILGMPFLSFRRFFSQYFHVNLLLMWAVFAAFHGVRIYEKYRERELESAQLEGRLAQAQNQALRMQLQPHFLFNTLNSISALVSSDGEAAERMLSRLADLLRLTLDPSLGQEVPLRQELAFIEAYLGIERIRFQDRLHVHYEVPAECLEARVPAFLLQPLVENAIRHGVADLARPSTLVLRARREEAWLHLEVEDAGKGLGENHAGIGTSNPASRLRLMFKERQAFELESAPGRGTRARIRIPWLAGEGAP